MFAGKIATKKITNKIEVSFCHLGTNRVIAASISRKPVINMTICLNGVIAGNIMLMPRVYRKCALAVKINIAAIAILPARATSTLLKKNF